MLKLKQQQTGGCWKREIYDSEGYEVIFRINPDTGKLVKINFKSKNPMNFIEIINTTRDNFYIEFDRTRTVFAENIDEIIKELEKTKALIKFVKEFANENYIFEDK